MQLLKVFVIILLTFTMYVPSSFAAKGKLATREDIDLLKSDILNGRIKVGKTRLKNVQDLYGNADNISETATRITFDYGDLRIEFSKDQLLKDWGYDYSKSSEYSDDIDDLRYDLNDGQIVGNFVKYRDIAGDYGDPTEAHEKSGDGEMSVYYYGSVKLKFENVYTVRSWRGKRLQNADDTGETKQNFTSTSGAAGKGGVY